MKKEFKFKSGKRSRLNFSPASRMLTSDIRTEIISNREIEVEGFSGVFEFSDTYIKLNLKDGSMSICGKGLNITGFDDETVTVAGTIEAVEFLIRENEKND